MTTTRAGTWDRTSTTVTPEAATPALRRLALWGLVLAKLIAGWGVQWDIQWHVRIGRDSFWIAPHVMTYAGVAATVLLSFGVLAWETWRRLRSRGVGDEITVMGITGTPGYQLAAWGIALTVLAAPIDDLWHRLFGIDVTLWSPPHLLGLLGSLINTIACMLIAGEVYRAGSHGRTWALVANAALLLGGLATSVSPAFRLAYLHGGVSFHLYAILGALLFPLAYLPVAKLSGKRWAPLAALVLSVMIGMIGTQIARVGFEIMQPVSVIEEEIAKDPTSPIAVANAIAQKNRELPATRGLALQFRSLLPVLLLILIDPRRRPLSATVAYAVAVVVTVGWQLTHSPAFSPMTPGVGATAIALALTILAALVGAVAGRWLSDALNPDPERATAS